MNFKDTDDLIKKYCARHVKPRVALKSKSLKQIKFSLGYLTCQSRQAMGEMAKRTNAYLGKTKKNVDISFETSRRKTFLLQFNSVDDYLQVSCKGKRSADLNEELLLCLYRLDQSITKSGLLRLGRDCWMTILK